MQDVYDRSTERVRLALALAAVEAGGEGAPDARAVGPEHLLLGLLRERDGVAAQALRTLGVDEERLRWALTARGPAAGPPPGRSRPSPWSRLRAAFRRRPHPERLPALAEIELTPPAQEALRGALADVQRLDHHVIATEHLLLQLVRDEQGSAAAALWRLDVTPAQLRAGVHEVIAQARRQSRRI